MSGLRIGYAIHNSTKTTASHDLTDLEVCQGGLLLRGTDDKGV
ncbi:MAG: hypothetical protein QOJ28_107, partial [Mycobacterium sp.]|nr:hypothetical protein [Mycobacterium sp.]